MNFSKGNFSIAFPYLADEVEWNVVGDKIIKGKEHVIDFCIQTAAYFASVTTVFAIVNVITSADKVAINGTAEFINKENKTTSVSSCDVYLFENGLLTTITSYCIVTNK